MKITYDYKEFLDTTEPIFHPRLLAELGLKSPKTGGTFPPEEVDQLSDFCDANPEYHIMTYRRGGIWINRYEEGGFSYALAKGDKDPKFAFNPKYIGEYFAVELEKRMKGA